MAKKWKELVARKRCGPVPNFVSPELISKIEKMIYWYFSISEWPIRSMGPNTRMIFVATFIRRPSGTLPTRVQILVLAPFSGFSRIYRRYALSGKRRSRRRRGAIGDFGNLQICRCPVLQRCS
jgi:hypothetical protein